MRMPGQNQIRFSKGTMKEIVQYWLNNKTMGNTVSVTDFWHHHPHYIADVSTIEPRKDVKK